MFQFFCYVMMIMCQITTSTYTPVFQCVINREIDVENDSLLQRANVLASKIRFATTNVYWVLTMYPRSELDPLEPCNGKYNHDHVWKKRWLDLPILAEQR